MIFAIYKEGMIIRERAFTMQVREAEELLPAIALRSSQIVTLRRLRWAEATKSGQGCPFKWNRGFDPDDERCHVCPENDPEANPKENIDANRCIYETQRRLATILNRLRVETGEVDEEVFQDDDVYLNTTRGEMMPANWFKEMKKDIREIANAITKHPNITDITEIETILHPNTLTLFRNSFPEWLEYEKYLDALDLERNMHDFWQREREKVFRNPPADTSADEPDEIEQFLIVRSDWQGFDFNDLYYQSEHVPKKVIKQFTRDYFKWKRQTLNREQQVARELGLFGGKKEEGERFPMKWMLSNDNATIKNFIESNNGKFFCELMNYMERNRMKMQEGERIAEKLNAGGNKYVVVQVDRKAAAKDLQGSAELKNVSVHEKKIYGFLKWMEKHGLIIKLGKPGKNEHTAYAIGKWTSYPDPETGEMKPGKMSFFVKQRDRANLKQAAQDKNFW